MNMQIYCQQLHYKVYEWWIYCVWQQDFPDLLHSCLDMMQKHGEDAQTRNITLRNSTWYGSKKEYLIHSPRTMLDIVPQITHLFSKLSYTQNWIIRFAALDVWITHPYLIQSLGQTLIQSRGTVHCSVWYSSKGQNLIYSLWTVFETLPRNRIWYTPCGQYLVRFPSGPYFIDFRMVLCQSIEN